MKKYKRIIKIILSIIGISFGLYCIVFTYESFKEFHDNPMELSNRIPNSFLGVFTNEAQKDLTLIHTTIFKLRPPIATFSYQNKYTIILSKVDSNSNLNIENSINLIHDNKIDGNRSSGFIDCSDREMTVNFKLVPTKLTLPILLSLNGEIIETVVSNDTTRCYYIKLNSLYVKLHQSDEYDIFIQKKQENPFKTDVVPVSLMFLRRGKTVYFLFLYSNDDNIKVKANILMDITNLSYIH
jgi:hypothetical protein